MRSLRLQELLPDLVRDPHEARSYEYKCALEWDDAKFLVTRAALGMVNTRDGGFIVLGVKEENKKLVPTGLTKEQIETFVPDKVADHITKFASERVEVKVDLVEELVSNETLRFIVIEVSQFRSKPVFSRKGTPDGTPSPDAIKDGVLYVRPFGGKPESRQATAEDHDEVIQLAVELRLRNFVETVNKASLTLQVDSGDDGPQDAYDLELGGL